MGRFDVMNFLLGLKQSCQCFSRLLFQQPEIVYVGISQGIWGYLRDLMFILPALLLKKRLVLHLRGSEFRVFYEQMPRWLRRITRYVLARTAHIIVLGHSLKSIFDGLIPPERIAVIPNGIDSEEFTRADVSHVVSSGRRLLYLSSLRKRKGPF